MVTEEVTDHLGAEGGPQHQMNIDLWKLGPTAVFTSSDVFQAMLPNLYFCANSLALKLSVNNFLESVMWIKQKSSVG